MFEWFFFVIDHLFGGLEGWEQTFFIPRLFFHSFQIWFHSLRVFEWFFLVIDSLFEPERGGLGGWGTLKGQRGSQTFFESKRTHAPPRASFFRPFPIRFPWSRQVEKTILIHTFAPFLCLNSPPAPPAPPYFFSRFVIEILEWRGQRRKKNFPAALGGLEEPWRALKSLEEPWRALKSLEDSLECPLALFCLLLVFSLFSFSASIKIQFICNVWNDSFLEAWKGGGAWKLRDFEGSRGLSTFFQSHCPFQIRFHSLRGTQK